MVAGGGSERAAQLTAGADIFAYASQYFEGAGWAAADSYGAGASAYATIQFTVNPKALEEADALDRERKAGKVRGPLHGIPIALKDNIHTTSLPTSGGALAFDGFIPPYASPRVLKY